MTEQVFYFEKGRSLIEDFSESDVGVICFWPTTNDRRTTTTL